MTSAEAYDRVHDRILTLVDDEVADRSVPTCPGWTIKDVVAHLASFFAVYRSGDPREAFSAGWGDRAVEERRDLSLQECIAEWDAHLADAGDLFESPLGTVAISDALAHEQDIRTALERPGFEDDESIVPSVERGLAFVEQKAEAEGSPALRIVTEDIDRQVGQGEPTATLRTTTFELFRTIHGRRTLDQVRAMEWSGDPGRWVSDLFIFGPAERTVEE
jgi:uncharacterized protein (TIGR03083 family)